MSAIGVRF